MKTGDLPEIVESASPAVRELQSMLKRVNCASFKADLPTNAATFHPLGQKVWDLNWALAVGRSLRRKLLNVTLTSALQIKERLASDGIQWEDDLSEYQVADDYCDVREPLICPPIAYSVWTQEPGCLI